MSTDLECLDLMFSLKVILSTLLQHKLYIILLASPWCNLFTYPEIRNLGKQILIELNVEFLFLFIKYAGY